MPKSKTAVSNALNRLDPDEWPARANHGRVRATDLDSYVLDSLETGAPYSFDFGDDFTAARKMRYQLQAAVKALAPEHTIHYRTTRSVPDDRGVPVSVAGCWRVAVPSRRPRA